MVKAEREGNLTQRVRFLARNSLLIVDEIGYLPVGLNGGNLFFQLINACYERCAIILTSNRSFGEWGEVFGDSVVAAALLDRLLHHAVVVHIEGSSYRLREHADLLPEHLRNRPGSLNQAPARTQFVDGLAVQNGVLQIAIPADHRLHRVGIFTSILLGKLRAGLTDIQSLHRIRSLLMRDRIAQINQIRGLLAE